MRVSSLSRGSNPATGRFATADHVFVSLLWLAFYSQWATIIPTIIPDQIRVILGPEGINSQEFYNGIIIAAGNCVALIIAPIAGALSDRSRSRHGHRRPFLVRGILGACVGLLLIMPFGAGDSLLLYAVVIANLQFWWNWAAGPYAGLVADIVPVRDQVTASGWLNVMTIIGSALGSGLMAAIYVAGQPSRMVLIFIIINLACLGLTLVRVHEAPGAGIDTVAFGDYIKTFIPKIRSNTNFYWVLLTRLLAQMGIWPVLIFLLYYLVKVIGVAPETAPNLLSALLLPLRWLQYLRRFSRTG